MSGHSKWATIKRHKAAIDAKRGKSFSIIGKEITIAARAGGGDPGFNNRLRNLVRKAKAANMPADNIDRAIKKGTGELPGQIIEEITYEGYGPGGIGLIVEVTTDKKTRSASEVRSVFTKIGGNLAANGAVAFNFNRMGQFLIKKSVVTEDRLMEIALESGAEDIRSVEDQFELFCPVPMFDKVSNALHENKITFDSAELVYVPITTVSLTDVDAVKKALRLIDLLEGLEDVSKVFSNLEIDDEVLEQAHK
jgi:YebC/PmpR family DNA-binding regulatory protein